MVKPKQRLTLGNRLQDGDSIVLLESSGIHANGLTLARRLAEQLGDGYRSRISDGRMYGQALLDPTIIYSRVTQALFEAGVDVHYMANITGHGWRKLMRHPSPFTYRIASVPPVPAVLQFIVEKANLSWREAYGTFNMGAGFAIFVPSDVAEVAVQRSEEAGIRAYRAGLVEQGPRRVLIEPLGILFEEEAFLLWQ